MDIKKLANAVNSKLSSSLSYYDTKVYTDEPIIKTAAQLDNFLPEQYKKMKRIATDSSAVKKTRQQIFYEQAKLMESFEDDFSGDMEFRCFYPTYSAMNDKQLREYFSWRSSVHRGVAEETSLSFVYVYLYELLALIGTSGPTHSFRKIYNFWRAYRNIDVRLDAYVPVWLKDMVIFYDLDSTLLDGTYDDSAEMAVLALVNNDKDDKKQYCALSLLSAYNCDGSAFCKQNLKEFSEVAVRVFRGLFDYYEKKRTGGFAEKLFGRRVSCPYHIFSSAVFFDNSNYTDYTYNLNPIHTYRSTNGKWSCERYYGNLKHNKEIGNILKFIDCKMREKTNFRHTLKGEDIACTNKKLIEKIIDEYFAEKRRAEIPIISVNAQKLSSIRSEADIIMDKLIVDCEEEEAELVVSEEPEILTKNEKEFLVLILNGSKTSTFLKQCNMMLSVIVDSINEKLFEQFFDNVIFYDGETPAIYEDYIEELEGMFK